MSYLLGLMGIGACDAEGYLSFSFVVSCRRKETNHVSGVCGDTVRPLWLASVKFAPHQSHMLPLVALERYNCFVKTGGRSLRHGCA